MRAAHRRSVLVALLAAGCVSAPPVPAPSSTQPAGTTAATLITVPSTGPSTGPVVQPEPVPDFPLPDPAPPEPGAALPEGERGVAVIARGGADLADAPRGDPFVRAYEGLVMAVEDREGDWFLLRTPCDTTAWANGFELAFTPQANAGDIGVGFELAAATVVVDPGHGGPNKGASGPNGLSERIVNLDIGRRLRDLLASPHTVDWASGLVGPGDAVRSVGRVWLTRTEGPEGADYEAGLLFRTRVADMAGADALVSIHNNADPDGPFEGPGSEVYYSVQGPESMRLAGLMVEELRRGLVGFQAPWVGDTDAGAKPRLRADGVTDYYGILRRASTPAVITEGAFITSPDEEALLATADFRHAYASAVYRAMVRFLTTDDPGSGFTVPYERTVDAGSGNPLPTCQVPAQP